MRAWGLSSFIHAGDRRGWYEVGSFGAGNLIAGLDAFAVMDSFFAVVVVLTKLSTVRIKSRLM